LSEVPLYNLSALGVQGSLEIKVAHRTVWAQRTCGGVFTGTCTAQGYLTKTNHPRTLP
jgi:hypothetical protein